MANIQRVLNAIELKQMNDRDLADEYERTDSDRLRLLRQMELIRRIQRERAKLLLESCIYKDAGADAGLRSKAQTDLAS